MNKTIFIGRCDDDSHVVFPFHWANRVIEEAEKLELDINPFFVFLNGHGKVWCTTGHNRLPVLIANKNDYLLKGRIAYVVPLTIVNGGTPKEAFEKSQRTFGKWIDFWEKRWRGIERTKVAVNNINKPIKPSTQQLSKTRFLES